MRQRRIIIWTIATFFVLVFYMALVRTPGNSKSIPLEFSQARLQGALISQSIVALSDEAKKELEVIVQLGEKEKFSEALQRTALVLNQSREIREKAIELSNELDKMTRSLSAIDSVEARQAATEAITDWLSLISHLINYSGYLSRLMDGVKNRLAGVQDPIAISELIEKINFEIAEINKLDTKAREAIKRFDKLIK